MYFAWVAMMEDGALANEINEVGHLLMAALSATKSVYVEELTYLSVKYRRLPVTVKKALRQAFLLPSVTSFRALVRSWRQAGKTANVPIPREHLIR
jgi:hypothetical protein